MINPSKKNIQYFSNHIAVFDPFYVANHSSEYGDRIYALGIISSSWYGNIENSRFVSYAEFETLILGTLNHTDYTGSGKLKIVDLSEKAPDFVGIGVDSGFAGFISQDKFDDFTTKEIKGEIYCRDGCVVSRSGMGDGLYTLYGIVTDDDHIIGYFIDFDIEDQGELLSEALENQEVFRLFLDDLKEEKQKELVEFLGDNGNYDTYPIAVLVKNKED